MGEGFGPVGVLATLGGVAPALPVCDVGLVPFDAAGSQAVVTTSVARAGEANSNDRRGLKASARTALG